MADMGTVGDTVGMGVTGAIRNPPAKERSSRRQGLQRLMPFMAINPLPKKANGIDTGADVGSIETQN